MKKLGVYFILTFGIILFSFIGLTIADPNFDIQAATAPFINLQAPSNNSNLTTGYVNFTYNVSDVDAGDSVDNCTLFLNIDGAGFNANMTHYSTWVNQSNGVGVAEECGADDPYGITTNGTDFWFVDHNDDVMYHLNSTYGNHTDAFNVSEECGSSTPADITTNGSDFWIVDYTDDFVYHINSTLDNDTRAGLVGFSVGVECGAGNPRGITTNGSDFWIVDQEDDFVYHINSTFNNDTRAGLEGFSVGVECGSTQPVGLTTNGTDFWIVDQEDDFVYHVNASGDNKSDGFDIAIFGSDAAKGITTSSFNGTDFSGVGTPTEFWIVDSQDNSIYHIKDQVEQIINHTFNKTFGTDRRILWKVGCYDNNSYQGNSSEYNLTVDITVPTITLQTPKNNTNWTTHYINFTYSVTDDTSTIDSCILWKLNSGSTTWELNSTDKSITETINQSINLTVEDSNFLWRVECNDTLNHRGNSTIRNITIDTSVTSTGGGHSGVSSKSSSKAAIVTQDLTSTVEFSNPNIPVISVDLKLNKEADLQITVRKIFESFLSQKLENAYSYFAVESNLDNSNFEYIKLNFKVKKNYEDVELQQLFDQGNYKISATKIYQDKDYNYYQANINGLGYFVITANEKKEGISLSGETIKTLEDIKVKTGLVTGLLILVLFILAFYYVRIHKKKIEFNQH